MAPIMGDVDHTPVSFSSYVGRELSQRSQRSQRSVTTADMLAMLGDEAMVTRVKTGVGRFFTDASLTPGGSEMGLSPERGNARGVGLQATVERASAVVQKAAVAKSITLLDRHVMEDIVREHGQRFAGCLTLIFSLVFFTVYVAAASRLLDTTTSYLVEDPLRALLSPGLQQIHETKDVWNWLDSAFIPTFFRQADMNNQSLPNNEWSRVFSYNQLRGAIVFEQTRSARQSCSWSVASHLDCFPTNSLSRARFGRNASQLPASVNLSVVSSVDEGFVPSSAKAGGRRLELLRDELRRNVVPDPAPSDAIYKFLLYPNAPLQETRQRLDFLRQRGWLDQQSLQLTIKALTINAEMTAGLPRLDSMRVLFTVSRTGGIYYTLRFAPVFLRPLRDKVTVFVDVLLLVCILADTAWFLLAVVRAVRRGRLRGLLTRWETIFRVTNLGLTWFTAAGFLILLNKTMKLERELEKFGKLSGSELQTLSEELHNFTDEYVSFASWYELIVTYTNIVLMARCFIALRFQPRLAVVVETLKATSIDLAHFLIIFIPTFFAYALAGMGIFGRRYDRFASVERAVGVCFQIVMENQFDWEQMASEDLITSAVWAWSYLVIVWLIMLNMVLAIMLDVYSEVLTGMDSQETVWDTIAYSARRVRLFNQWIPESDLLESLRLMPKTMTLAEFQSSFPAMTEFQLRRLTNAAKARATSLLKSEASHSSGAEMTAAIKLGADKVSQLLRELRERRLKALAEERRSDRACIEDIMQSMSVQNHWMTCIQDQLDAVREKMRAGEVGKANVAETGDDAVSDLSEDAAG